jgi:serine/threonine-protein kinase HipA
VSELAIWMNGEHVGAWLRTRGTDAVVYDPSWIDSARGRPLSLSLPFTPGRRIAGAAVTNFFDNLLPDSRAIRERMGRRFQVKSGDTFELLSAIGRDCVGAVQLLPPERVPEGGRELNYDRLDADDVRQTLLGVAGELALARNPRNDDAFRISLAGAQEKTALLRVGKRWCLPHGSTPTTHILKLPMGVVGGMQGIDMSESVENEWLCLRLLDRMGLPSAAAEIGLFAGQKALCVERFDRAWMDDDTWVARLPQEDFCQATGTPPEQKYESDGGPGMRDCMALLAGSNEPDLDRERFLLSQFAFWMLGATDGHAKNFSIFLHAGGAYSLTPLYDVLSVYPILGRGKGKVARQKAHLAMSVHGRSAHSQLDYVKPRHWFDEALRSGVPFMLEGMFWLATVGVARAIDEVENELPPDFPASVWEPVTQGLLKCSRAFVIAAEERP